MPPAQEKVDHGKPIESREVPSRHKRPPPHPTRSAEVKCLRCGNVFVSWDLRQNRLCPVCAKKSW